MEIKEHNMSVVPPIVSVVIPAYNAAKFIHKTLDSVRSQSFIDYEIIVVDDGSHDETTDVVNNYLKNNSIRGCCTRQNNKGIAGARNTAIALAKGRFIALLDHDDIWYPSKLQRIIEEFRLHPHVGLVSHHLMMVKNGKKVGILKTGPASSRMYESLLFCSRGSLLAPTAAVFKKEKAVEIGGFRGNPEFNTAEDFDFWLRLSKVTEFHFINETLGEYTIIESGASKKILYHCKSVEAVLEDHFISHLGSNPNLIKQVRARKRLANLYRSVLYVLLNQNAPRDVQREFLIKMLKKYPFNLKNIVVATLWLFKR
jgi:glycosyltransferase involved in cell wall biosynthesis